MITIRHTHAEGTIAEGTSRGDGSADALKRAGFRWSRTLGAWYLPQSRDRLAKTYKISAAKAALEAAGLEVTTEVDETQRRDFAEAEAERYDRAEDRAERMAGYAASAQARSTAAYERSRQMAEAIPLGQPMMPDHYSYGRDRRYRDRMHALHGKSIEEGRKAEHFEHRAESAATTQASREDVPTTLRRIAKLEADQRRVKRDLTGRVEYVSTGTPGGYKPALIKPQGEYLERLTVLAADLAEQLAYWRAHVESAKAAGVKVWSAADFARGDFVRDHGTWAEVLRVNPKSLTVAWGINFVHLDVITQASARNAMGGPGWTAKIPYDKIRERRSAAEMAPVLAEMQQREAPAAS